MWPRWLGNERMDTGWSLPIYIYIYIYIYIRIISFWIISFWMPGVADRLGPSLGGGFNTNMDEDNMLRTNWTSLGRFCRGLTKWYLKPPPWICFFDAWNIFQTCLSPKCWFVSSWWIPWDRIRKKNITEKKQIQKSKPPRLWVNKTCSGFLLLRTEELDYLVLGYQNQLHWEPNQPNLTQWGYTAFSFIDFNRQNGTVKAAE